MQNSAFHPIHLRKRTALLTFSGASQWRIVRPAERPSRIVKSKVVTP